MKKKGQVWVIDYVAGFLIFIILVLISVNLMFSIKSNTSYEEAYQEALYLSSKLVSEGSPAYWNSTTVIIPGFAENNRINTTKLLEFDSLTYNITKSMFNIKGDYIFYFYNTSGIISIDKCVRGFNVSVDGSCNPNLTSLEYNNLVKIDRIVIYNSSIIQLKIYVWN